MNLYIVRHGNPDYSNDTLTDLGRTQAEACAEEMTGLAIDEIYSSPYGRATETAEYLAKKLALPVKIEPWTHEVEHYASNGRGGKTFAVQMDPSFLRSPEIENSPDPFSDPEFCGKENTQRMIKEVADGLDGFLAVQGYVREGSRYKIVTPNEKNVALYCHAGVFLIIAGHLLGIPQTAAWHSFFMYQTGITWCNIPNLSSGYTVPRFYYVNETSHLRERGLPLT